MRTRGPQLSRKPSFLPALGFSLYLSRSHPNPGYTAGKNALLDFTFYFHDVGWGEDRESWDYGTAVVCHLPNGTGSEFKLSLSSGRGSESVEVTHCCLGWGLLGGRHGDDHAGLGSRAPPRPENPQCRAQQLRRGDWEGLGCWYLLGGRGEVGRATEMRSFQFYPRILCSPLQEDSARVRPLAPGPWPLAGLTNSPV